MVAIRTPRLWFIYSLIGAAACQAAPSGPSISFTAPVAQAPANGATYNFGQQPIVLTIANAARSGPAAVTYEVEVSEHQTFSPLVFTTSVPESAPAVTLVTLPALTGNRTYYWRSRAVVETGAGGFSATSTFFIRPQVVLHAPEALSPAAGIRVFTARPVFVVRNAGRSGEPGTLTYEFQVSTTSTFATLAASGSVQEQPIQTSWTSPMDLPLGTLHWRVRAVDAASATIGPFSPAPAFERRPATGDFFDLSAAVIVLGPTDIASWPVTAQVTGTTANSSEICIEHPALRAWPGTIFFDEPGVLVQGNQWMFAFIDGRWYGGSGRWFRPDQPCKGINNDPFQGTFYMDGSEPLRSYVPRNGELIGLMATTPNRFYPSMRTVDERTNVVLVRFGG